MALISELRYPTTWYAKLITAILGLLIFAVLATATVSGFLLYRILSPGQTHGELDLASFPGHPSALPFTVPDAGGRVGWFFPGLKGAPTIILCHGYQSSRAELLTMVTALQENRYNVLVFDFAGHGSSPGFTTLGYRETRELRAAIEAVSRRSDVDANRFGLWGANMGGYAALAAAIADSRVRALVVDSVYDDPEQLVRLLLKRSGMGAPIVARAAQFGYHWLNYRYRNQPPLSERIVGLGGVAKLFIAAGADPELAGTTRELFERAPEPRELVVAPKGNYISLVDEEKRSYDNRLISFFLLRLPITERTRR